MLYTYVDVCICNIATVATFYVLEKGRVLFFSLFLFGLYWGHLLVWLVFHDLILKII